MSSPDLTGTQFNELGTPSSLVLGGFLGKVGPLNIKRLDRSGTGDLVYPNTGRGLGIGMITEMNSAEPLLFIFGYSGVTIVSDTGSSASLYTFTKSAGSDLTITSKTSAIAVSFVAYITY